ncbi:MAG TPA: hypothetical protein VFA07_06715 [Chthonomonadaceae bacterium]|nr:hypothetical protein [Chthonomonadaceae bacterium]
MLQLILLIVGVIWALRKPKLTKLTPDQFPGVPEPVFYEWKALELESINMFLWASWGVFLLSILAILITAAAFPTAGVAVQILVFVLFIAALVIADSRGKQVAKFKKQHGIQWPAKR